MNLSADTLNYFVSIPLFKNFMMKKLLLYIFIDSFNLSMLIYFIKYILKFFWDQFLIAFISII